MVHQIGVGAGSGAGAALDTYLNALTAGYSANFIHECAGFYLCFHKTSPDVRSFIDGIQAYCFVIYRGFFPDNRKGSPCSIKYYREPPVLSIEILHPQAGQRI
jgi:hypothetical protein